MSMCLHVADFRCTSAYHVTLFPFSNKVRKMTRTYHAKGQRNAARKVVLCHFLCQEKQRRALLQHWVFFCIPYSQVSAEIRANKQRETRALKDDQKNFTESLVHPLIPPDTSWHYPTMCDLVIPQCVTSLSHNVWPRYPTMRDLIMTSLSWPS